MTSKAATPVAPVERHEKWSELCPSWCDKYDEHEADGIPHPDSRPLTHTRVFGDPVVVAISVAFDDARKVRTISWGTRTFTYTEARHEFDGIWRALVEFGDYFRLAGEFVDWVLEDDREAATAIYIHDLGSTYYKHSELIAEAARCAAVAKAEELKAEV